MWIIIGIIIGGAFAALFWFLSKNKFSLKWYEWLMSGIGLLLLLWTIQNFTASFVEWEPKAAWMFLLIVGLPGLILLILPGTLAYRRLKGSS